MDGQQTAGKVDLGALRIDDRQRNNSRDRRKIRPILFIVLALVVIVIAFLFLRGTTPVVSVAIAKPAGEGGAATLLNASGYVTPRRRATVAAKITARVLDVLVDEGVVVTEGQVLARLDDADARRRLAAARTARDATAALITNLEVNLA